MAFAWNHLNLDRDARGRGPAACLAGVVEQHLVAASLDQHRRQTLEAGEEWRDPSIARIEIARVAAQARGDSATAKRAREIQRRVRGSRQRPGNGFIDRLSEWDAVVWTAAH